MYTGFQHWIRDKNPGYKKGPLFWKTTTKPGYKVIKRRINARLNEIKTAGE
jgi:hypothetical protein